MRDYCHSRQSPGTLRGMAPPKKKADAPRARLVAMGERIRTALEEAGVKQTDAAGLVGVRPHTFWRYTKGQVDPKNKLPAIAKVVNKSVEWLRGDDGAPELDETQAVVAAFIRDTGPTMRPPLTPGEARHLQLWPYHRVTPGKLLDSVIEMRRGLSADEIAGSAEATADAQARADALGVKRRK